MTGVAIPDASNLVPTAIGAAIATTKVLPHFKGLFDGVAVRAPVPVGISSILYRDLEIRKVKQL